MMTDSERRADAGVVATWLTDIFSAAGCPADEAGLTGRHLVEADLSGHPSHGIVRTARYLEWLRDGRMRTPAKTTIVTRTPSLAIVDGHFSFGQVLGHRVVDLAGDMAEESGVAVVGLRHAGHLGRIGAWAELLAERGLVSIHFVSVPGSRLVAPFGAFDPLISTAPVAIGVPRGPGDPEPFILDFATSRVAEGKVLVALKTGKALPSDALVDRAGRDTNDPATLYGASAASDTPKAGTGTAALQAMGQHKGSGLALACELVAGALIGSGTNADPQARFCNGMLSIVLDPARFGPTEGIGADVDRFIAFVRSAAPRDPSSPVMTPGDPERARRASCAAEGVPIGTALFDMLETASADLRVPVPGSLWR